MASDLDVNDPVFPQHQKRSQMYEEGTEEEHFPSSMYDVYHDAHPFEALDSVSNGIQKRFNQPGYQQECMSPAS